jgi:hypothetical protein
MKIVRIYRDTETRKVGYRLLEGHKVVQQELSTYTDIRKLRRHLRRTLGKSIIM